MTTLFRATPGRSFCAWLVLFILSTCSLAAQTNLARVRIQQENFRRNPNGRILAAVFRGTELPVVGQSGRWVEVELGGWIWARSVGTTRREGFNLIVTADGGENLRAEADDDSRIVARLLEGFLLDRVQESGAWVQVRRRGWLWAPSLELGAGAPASAAAGAENGDSPEEDAGPTLLTAPSSLPLHDRPDGDTVAVMRPGRRAQVFGRAGDWLRVRVDGWVYAPAVGDSAAEHVDTGDLTPAQLRADPARYRGALVRWRVQFISLRNAEPVRADFQEGEPFIQARGPAGDPGFVYLAVPDPLLETVREIQPLEYITVVGRVRTGRSSLTGAPIIDLTDIESDSANR